MTAVAAFIGLLFVLLWAWLAGRALLSVLGVDRCALDGGLDEGAALADAGARIAIETMAGLLVIHLALQLLDLATVPWRRWTIVAAAVVTTAALGWSLLRRRSPEEGADRAGRQWRLGIGDVVAGAAVLAFAVACYTLRSPFGDFVYHLGLKGKRFFLAGGIDFEFLGRPENSYIHPDYPNLMPELFASVAIVGGSFFEPVLMVLAAVFLMLTVLVCRSSLQSFLNGWQSQAGVAGLALALSAFSIGYYQGGGADIAVALAVVAGAVSLQRTPRGQVAPEIGLIAAFGAAVKIEGLGLAVILLLLAVWRCRSRALLRPRALLLLLGPPALVVSWWGFQVTHHGLFQEGNTGALELGNAALVIPAMVDAALISQWHGLPLLFLGLPLALAIQRTRRLAAVVVLQLGFYVYVYLSSPLEPIDYLVAASFPRLLLHLMPAVLLGALLLWGQSMPPAVRSAACYRDIEGESHG